MASNFKFCRVKVAHDDGTEAADREPMWLVMEWPDGESHPTKFILTSLRRRRVCMRSAEQTEGAPAARRAASTPAAAALALRLTGRAS